MTTENNMDGNVVKRSNIGFVAGVLLVALLGMWVVKSSLFKNKTEIAEAPVDTSNFEIVEESETNLLDDVIIEAFNSDNAIEEDSTEEIVTEEASEIVEIKEDDLTHEPVDTAIGDHLGLILSLSLLSGVGLLQLSKRVA